MPGGLCGRPLCQRAMTTQKQRNDGHKIGTQIRQDGPQRRDEMVSWERAVGEAADDTGRTRMPPARVTSRILAANETVAATARWRGGEGAGWDATQKWRR